MYVFVWVGRCVGVEGHGLRQRSANKSGISKFFSSYMAGQNIVKIFKILGFWCARLAWLVVSGTPVGRVV